jgi:hypothetical protein
LSFTSAASLMARSAPHVEAATTSLRAPSGMTPSAERMEPIDGLGLPPNDSNSAGCAQESYYVGRARDCSRYFTPRSLTSIPAAGIVCIQVRQELFIRDVGNRGGSGPRICALKKDGKRVG